MDLLFSLFEEPAAQMPEEVPLFPMPQTVLLPGEPLPLHVFEERYRIMAETALAGDRLIAMAHMKKRATGRERPDVYGVAGLGRIVMEERLADGRFNLVLLGMKRVRVLRMAGERPFPRARVEVLPDRYSQTSSGLIDSLSEELLGLARALKEEWTMNGVPEPQTGPVLEDLFDDSISLGTLCDLLASGFSLPPAEKQLILEETDVIRRTETVLFALKFELESLRLARRRKPATIN